MANILIRGPLLTQSGYGVHSRQVFKWLLAAGHNINVQALPWGITPWYLNGDALDGLVGEIMKRTGQPTKLPDISFQIQLPDEWDTNIAKINIGITAAVETNFCNPEWVIACNKMNGIIVPSKFTKGVLENSGRITVPIRVIPESFPENFVNENKPNKFIKVKSKHNFLLFGQLTATEPKLDRKNTVNAIRLFCEKYKKRKDIGLIVKTNMGTNSTLDKRISVKTLKGVVNQVRKGKYPRIYLLHGNMTDAELFSLYNDRSIIGLISATRGEGYGLPMIEAAASGLPVLATDWSGHKTFLQKGSWLPVKYVLNKIDPRRVDNRIFMQDSLWADIDEDDFKNKMDLLFKRRIDYRNKAKKQRKHILENFSQTSINKLYDNFMEELL